MTSQEVRKKYLDFFAKKGHKVIPSSSLVPENDPTTLFTSAGMQPMMLYILGEPHPEGKRIVDCQKVFRSVDIEEVGADATHLTFFEMLGNWSFGDYWKEQQLSWFLEFLTAELGLDPQRLYISVFEGDSQIPKDEETTQIWQKLFQEKGIEAKVGERIFYYQANKNWWSRSGTPEQMPAGEPGGPDSEVFYLFPNIPHNPKFGPQCQPNCDCGRFLEIGNSVFMQYQKLEDGSFKELPNKNVDFGGGLERLTAATVDQPDVFKTDSYWPIIEKLQEQLGLSYTQTAQNFRVIADHIKAATFLIKDGVLPSNKLQGYVLRRLLRRAAVRINTLRENSMNVLPKLVDPVIDIYSGTNYFQTGDWDQIRQIIEGEIKRFSVTINHGLKKLDKYLEQNLRINGLHAFDLFQSDGFPPELVVEIARQKNAEVTSDFWTEFENARIGHSELSRTTSVGIFKGGLADQTEQTTKLHTATHMLQAATKQILGKEVGQRGSHITADRLRWDFNYPQKLTDDQIKQIEDLVNQKIQEDLKIWFDLEERDEAITEGATTNFGEHYPDKVKVYKIGFSVIPSDSEESKDSKSRDLSASPQDDSDLFSQELCGGPHVEHTGVLGHFKILKEEGVSSGIRRIYATVN